MVKAVPADRGLPPVDPLNHRNELPCGYDAPRFVNVPLVHTCCGLVAIGASGNAFMVTVVAVELTAEHTPLLTSALNFVVALNVPLV